MNWPNRVTVLRMILVPVFILAVFYQNFNFALGVFILAAVSDAFDGYLARTRNEKTKLGTILDPIADKLLIGSAFISLSLISGVPEHLRLPAYVPIIIISRDILIFTGVGVIYMLNSRTEISPTILGKITTFMQMMTIILILLRFDYSSWIWNAAVICTLISGFDYVRRASRSFNEQQK